MRLLTIIMTYDKRLNDLPQVVANAKQQSIKTDVCVWANTDADLGIDDEDVIIMRGNNNWSLTQRFVPALVSNYDFVLYQDDDLLIGSRFFENAIDYIKTRPDTIVVCGGSVIRHPYDAAAIKARKFSFGKHLTDPLHVDMPCSGGIVCRPANLTGMFAIQKQLKLSSIDCIMAAGHTGDFIVLPAKADPNADWLVFLPSHAQGQCDMSDRWKEKRQAEVEIVAASGIWGKPEEEYMFGVP